MREAELWEHSICEGNEELILVVWGTPADTGGGGDKQQDLVMMGFLCLNLSSVPYKCWSNMWTLLTKSGEERMKTGERQAFVVSQVVETIN